MYANSQFTEDVGPSSEIDIESPLSIFLNLLPDSFLTKIVVEQSNLYATQLLKIKNLRK